MATIAWELLSSPYNGSLAHVLWRALSATNADGAPYASGSRPDKTITVQGTFGGTVTIQGSNELVPTTWMTLNDPQGNPLTFTAARTELISENTLWIRPVAAAGVTTVDVYLLAGTPRALVA